MLIRLLALLVTIPALTLSAASRADVDALVRRLMAAEEVPGLSIAVLHRGNGFSIMPDLVTAILGGNHPAFAWMRYEHYDAASKRLLRDVRARGAKTALADNALDALTESQINAIGYTLLELNRVADAVSVFEANAARFPASANAHDSLGEAYAAATEREKAIASYQRSVELDPKNANAVEWLQRLRRP